MEGFDRKDLALLFELEWDGRASLSDLAKKLHVSKQVVSYRLERLEKSGAILGFFTVVNASKLGYSDFEVWFKLKSVDRESVKKALKILSDWEYVRWVARCGFEFDVACGIYARNAVHFSSQLEELSKLLGQSVSSFEVSSITQVEHFESNFLVNTPREKTGVSHLVEEPERVTLTKNESKVLEGISKNARTSLVELSKKIGLSEKSVRQNLRDLQSNGVIVGYSGIPRLHLLGFHTFEVLLSFSSHDKARLKELGRYCSSHPSISYFILCIGRWKATIAVVVKTQDEFDEIFGDLRSKFKDIVEDSQIVLMKEFVKFNYLPPLS